MNAKALNLKIPRLGENRHGVFYVRSSALDATGRRKVTQHIGPATKVAEVSIKVSAATGAQLKELLKKLPDGMTFELTLEKEDI